MLCVLCCWILVVVIMYWFVGQIKWRCGQIWPPGHSLTTYVLDQHSLSVGDCEINLLKLHAFLWVWLAGLFVPTVQILRHTSRGVLHPRHAGGPLGWPGSHLGSRQKESRILTKHHKHRVHQQETTFWACSVTSSLSPDSFRTLQGLFDLTKWPF